MGVRSVRSWTLVITGVSGEHSAAVAIAGQVRARMSVGRRVVRSCDHCVCSITRQLTAEVESPRRMARERDAKEGEEPRWREERLSPLPLVAAAHTKLMLTSLTPMDGGRDNGRCTGQRMQILDHRSTRAPAPRDQGQSVVTTGQLY